MTLPLNVTVVGAGRPVIRVLSTMAPSPNVPVTNRHERSWRVVGEVADRGSASELGARECVLAAVPYGMHGATEPELAELVKVDKRKIGAPLRGLVDDGAVIRDGEGRKGEPGRVSRRP